MPLVFRRIHAPKGWGNSTKIVSCHVRAKNIWSCACPARHYVHLKHVPLFNTDPIELPVPHFKNRIAKQKKFEKSSIPIESHSELSTKTVPLPNPTRLNSHLILSSNTSTLIH